MANIRRAALFGKVAFEAKGSEFLGRIQTEESGSEADTLEQLRFQFFTDGNTDFWDSHTEAEVREHIRTAADSLPIRKHRPV